MTRIADAIEVIQIAERAVGLAELARQAEVPYTTAHSFRARDWSHKHLIAFERLEAAARRINGRAATSGEAS